jgi:hypothetical protein
MKAPIPPSFNNYRGSRLRTSHSIVILKADTIAPAGHVPKEDEVIAREAGSIEPSVFYEKYVKARKPVVLTGLPQGDEWRGLSKLVGPPICWICL